MGPATAVELDTVKLSSREEQSWLRWYPHPGRREDEHAPIIGIDLGVTNVSWRTSTIGRDCRGSFPTVEGRS